MDKSLLPYGRKGLGLIPISPPTMTNSKDSNTLPCANHARRKIKNVMLKVLATIVNGPRVATMKKWRRKASVGITTW